jgi:methyl-accepting chemotaxis protein
MRLLGLAVCLALLALVAAGCGGDDGGGSAEAWADDFCTAVTDWTDELEQLGEELGDVSSLTAESIRQAAEDANTATDDFVQRLRDLGAPDTESGDEVESELNELADEVEAQRDEIQEAVEDVEGLGGAAEAIGEIGTALATMGTAIQEALEAVEEADVGGELKAAFENSDACDEITN